MPVNPCPISPASHVVIYSQLVTFPGETEPFKDHPSTCGCLTGFRNKPQQKQPEKLSALILPEMLVSVYSYCVMVKSVSCCCVLEARFSQIQSHMYHWYLTGIDWWKEMIHNWLCICMSMFMYVII